MPNRQPLAEARPTLLAEATGTPGRYRVQLINPGWGSSGHYSPDVLAEAATRKVFPAGLKMFADHPTITEETDRPERSVRDVWGKLVTDATVGSDGELLAEVQVRPDVEPVVDFLSDAIGLSLRGAGTFEIGEAEGRTGRIITRIEEATSVDFVTDAGRGGQILGLVESARRTMLGETTANDVRDALNTAVDDAHGGDEIYTWVRDYDPDKALVYFDVSGNVDPRGTFQQGYLIADDGSAALTDERAEVTPRTEYVPVSPAGSTTTTSQGGTMPQIEEARLRQLEEAHGRVPTLEAERDTEKARADTAEKALAESHRRDAARPVLAEAFTGTTLKASKVGRLTESLLADLPAKDDGSLDADALKESATKVRTDEEAELAEFLTEAGVGRPRGFGSTTPVDGEVTREHTGAAIAEAFGRDTTTKTKEA